MNAPRRTRVTPGLAVFVALSFSGSWFVAAALRLFELSVQPAALGTRLFTTSLLYAVAMGWQPLVATWIVRRFVDPPDGLDVGLRPARPIFSVVATLGAFAFAAGAMAIAWAATEWGLVDARAFGGSREAELDGRAPSLLGAVVLSLALLGTLAFVWVQAFTEEVGWRGYFLPRAMLRFGRWRGLALHGLVWGVWYAPVLFLSSYDNTTPFGSAGQTMRVFVSCILLGTLLGFLRLVSNSVAPSIVANSIVTLLAGLPYLICGVDPGLRSALFGPPGWLITALAIFGLMASRWREAVRIPDPVGPGLLRVWIISDEPKRVERPRLLN